MTTVQPLALAALYRCCDPAKFTFTTTADLHDSDSIIGQTRAVEQHILLMRDRDESNNDNELSDGYGLIA